MNLTANQKAFLDTIAYSEIGKILLAKSDNGYNVLVGGKLFSSYARHPGIYVAILDRSGNPVINPKSGKPLISSAAGRYQILHGNAISYTKSLNLPDFSPASQDAIAMQLIKEQRAIRTLAMGNFYLSVKLCANIWASFPSASYGQHENKMEDLRVAYVKAGGTLA